MPRFAPRLSLCALGLLAACATPPPGDYVTAGGRGSAPGVPIGSNATGEACTQQSVGTGGNAVAIYCGTWQQPSALANRLGPAPAGGAGPAATSGPWRAGLDLRYACTDPVPTTILGREPALLLRCTRRVGGWPHLALVAAIGGQVYAADGVQPSLPVMERAIGVLSGRTQPAAAGAAPPSEAIAQLVARLSAQAFSAGDVGHYEELMRLGTAANQREDFASAAKAFRAALAVQEKALGPNNPNIVGPLMHLALQDSNQGFYGEADALFSRAEALAPRADDPTAPARLLHYRALHAMNQGHYERALALLDQAEATYPAPPAALARNRIPASARLVALRGIGPSLAAMLPDQELLVDPTAQSALVGIVEVRRNRATVLRLLGRTAESETASRSARALALANGLQDQTIRARIDRTAGSVRAAGGDLAASYADYARSAAAFHSALPRSRPAAETDLLAADGLLHGGDLAGTLRLCRGAIALLRELRVGAPPDLLQPCLDGFARQAEADQTNRRAILAEMFEASQLAQGGVTSQQIAEATARLSESARDPKAGQAIRRKQDANQKLDALYLRRDQMISAAAGGGADTAEIDRQIVAAQAVLADADQVLQAASPNLGQLVQQVAPAAEVLKALRPGEALAAITVSDRGGWTFLLRDGGISVGRMAQGSAAITKLVQRVRAGVTQTTAELPRFDTAAAQQLYQATLGPVQAALSGAKSLVVVPTGALLSVPFALLLTGTGDPDHLGQAPWLVRAMTIAHVPGAANFVALRRLGDRAAAPRPWFGFGDFRPATLAQAERTFPGPSCAESARLFADLPRLPYAPQQLEAARALLGGAPSDQLVGAAFTAAAVMQAPLKDYRVLHFATHGLLPTDLACMSEPAIVTSTPPGAPDASGSLLTALKILDLDLNAELVILSACNSGGPGGRVAGESLSGLARSFFYRGARSLLVTHWSVNDQVASYVVARTLDFLTKDNTTTLAAALRDAELAILAEAGDQPLAHPLYWAPFALIGDGGETLAAPAAAALSPARTAGL